MFDAGTRTTQARGWMMLHTDNRSPSRVLACTGPLLIGVEVSAEIVKIRVFLSDTFWLFRPVLSGFFRNFDFDFDFCPDERRDRRKFG